VRLNISVPDALAEEVRQRNISISAVCQRALREEVDRRRLAEDATDIYVYVAVDENGPFDPAEHPDYVDGTPTLIYQRYPVGRRLELGWVLSYEEGDEIGDNPNEEFTVGDPGDPPIEWARGVVRRSAEERQWERRMGDMQEITVEVGDPALTVGFIGRWLVEPDPDQTRGGGDAGAYWGIALTKRGRIAVYTAHVNERWPAILQDYDSLDQAADDDVPDNIIALAAAELGEHRVLWRDI
jgi:hypothetical protein